MPAKAWNKGEKKRMEEGSRRDLWGSFQGEKSKAFRDNGTGGLAASQMKIPKNTAGKVRIKFNTVSAETSRDRDSQQTHKEAGILEGKKKTQGGGRPSCTLHSHRKKSYHLRAKRKD